MRNWVYYDLTGLSPSFAVIKLQLTAVANSGKRECKNVNIFQYSQYGQRQNPGVGISVGNWPAVVISFELPLTELVQGDCLFDLGSTNLCD